MTRLRTAAPATLTLLAACGGEAAPADPAPDPRSELALVVDGIGIPMAELREWLAWLETFDRTTGRKTRIRYVLERHLLPVAFARRDHAGARERMRARARELHDLTAHGGHPALAEVAPRYEGSETGDRVRSDLPLTVQQWAFDPEHLLVVSPPLESPRGFHVAATDGLHQGLRTEEDRVELCLVPFHTHDPAAYGSWWSETRNTVADRVTWVHPEVRGALPLWLQPPPGPR